MSMAFRRAVELFSWKQIVFLYLTKKVKVTLVSFYLILVLDTYQLDLDAANLLVNIKQIGYVAEFNLLKSLVALHLQPTRV